MYLVVQGVRKLNVYDHLSYQNVIREMVLERKRLNPKSNFQNMAKYMRIQKAYLSQVIKGARHLSQDQLYLACKYLELSSQETRYMEILLEYARCGLADRKDDIQNYLEIFRASLKTEAKDGKLVSEAVSNQYYRQPLNQIVHVCLKIEAFRKDPRLMQKALCLPEEKIASVLKDLEVMGIIELETGGEVTLKNKIIPPPSDESIIQAWKTGLNSLANNRMNFLANNDSFNFSFVFGADKETIGQIQMYFDQFLSRVARLTQQKTPKDVYQLNCDLFSWTQLDQ